MVMMFETMKIIQEILFLFEFCWCVKKESRPKATNLPGHLPLQNLDIWGGKNDTKPLNLSFQY